MSANTLTIANNPVFKLINEARAVYTRRMAGTPAILLPRFEDYVFELCQVARELRQTGTYDRTSTLPSDSIMRRWYADLRRQLS